MLWQVSLNHFKDPFYYVFNCSSSVYRSCFYTSSYRFPLQYVYCCRCNYASGIVVNNGIVLVDYINLLIGRGEKLEDACVRGGVSRLRPILMTTLTTILGMAPLAFIPGEGSELVQPIGQAVIGALQQVHLLHYFLFLQYLQHLIKSVLHRPWNPGIIISCKNIINKGL